ncbi:nitrite reductase large subunit NirB [Paenibacillus arenilitoris]|uniref:NAD(P)/FAD-dependent oxidoreductase n=1 Tax=Paenibacillus arenilitoris TaxID=2772299 RepID=A0A927H6U7_9BACL|nr:nitrite reductase large subunit NirB [Paenibacillus arenilitoris]MBD2869943.1 NAD(P)/FAD-dependent oxidoreductase [Paenibacillus arenilitoris]
MKRKKLVVIGNGMAGIKCVEEICKLEPQLYDITVFGSEPHPNYNRILLSKVLQGDSSIDDITINDWAWYKERNIRLYTGETVVRIHPDSSTVETQSGLRAEYDSLIIATGSSAFIPPISGIHKSGVISFRNIEDCRKMMDYAKKYRKAAVIGGGLLGLEAARGLLNLGMETDVIHNAPYLMNRQLDRTAADMLRKELEGQGMRFWLNKETESITGLNRAKGVRFTGGSSLEADLIVVSVGIRPNIELARGCGLETNRAIVVDDYMRTSIPDIYAVGECAEHRGIAYGLVAPLYEQGKVLASVVCGRETPPYTGSIPYAQLKVSGVEVFSVGDIREDEAETAMQLYDGIKGTYKKVTMRDGIVRGAILYGNTAEGMKLLDLVKRKSAVTALAASPGDGESGGFDEAAASMQDRETVCACNAVRKSAIMEAVIEDGMQTVDEVRDCTKASSSCGGCRPMVEAVIRFALRQGRTAEKQAEPAVCGCTEIGHERLKSAIAEAGFGSHSEVMRALGWTKPAGCGICRPAVSYYLALNGRQDANSRSDVDVNIFNIGLSVGIVTEEEQAAPGPFDSRSLGTALYRRWEGVPFPAPVNAAVTAGLHRPAGVLVRDIGITGAPSGWEIYAAGHAEHPVKQGQLVGIARDEAEALAMSVSCLQLYRESAAFGEPMWKWMERYGIIEIRETLLDAEFRSELLARAGAPDRNDNKEEGLGETYAAYLQ